MIRLFEVKYMFGHLTSHNRNYSTNCDLIQNVKMFIKTPHLITDSVGTYILTNEISSCYDANIRMVHGLSMHLIDNLNRSLRGIRFQHPH